MAMYQLNMAREQVLPLEKRRLWFRWVFFYLAMSVVAIAFVAYHLTLEFVDLSARCGNMDDRERLFLRQRPGAHGVDECLRKVTSGLVNMTASLDAVAQFRGMGQKSADIVLGLAESLPQGVDVGRLALDADGGTVKVEVYVPVSMKQDGGLTQPSVISRWESSSLLTNRIHQITSENSQRVNFEGRDYLSWRFSGMLGGVTK